MKETTVLDTDVRQAVIDRLLERVNEARAACEKPTLAKLEPSTPGHIHQCVLANNLDSCGVESVYPESMYVRGSHEAMAIAGAWGTVVTVSEQTGSISIKLPNDVAIASQAFDARQLPEISNPHVEYGHKPPPVSATEIGLWISVDG